MTSTRLGFTTEVITGYFSATCNHCIVRICITRWVTFRKEIHGNHSTRLCRICPTHMKNMHFNIAFRHPWYLSHCPYHNDDYRLSCQALNMQGLCRCHICPNKNVLVVDQFYIWILLNIYAHKNIASLLITKPWLPNVIEEACYIW